mgnify:CR=1 FL=1
MAEISSIDGIAEGNIDKVDSLVKANISNINGYSFPELFNELFNFEDQTTNESGGSDWNPNNTHSGWETDTAVVTGGGSWGNPASNGNTITDGWNLGFGGTGSSGTGPNGGVHSDLDGSHDTSGRYMYVEGTGVKDDRVCVVRSPGINFSTSMLSTSNDLDLKFWLHQYSSVSGQGHDLFVYIDDASTSTESDATLLLTVDDFSAYTGNSSNWVQYTVSLNSYRTVDASHFIYFVADGATSFRCDIAIDNVQFLES